MKLHNKHHTIKFLLDFYRAMHICIALYMVSRRRSLKQQSREFAVGFQEDSKSTFRPISGEITARRWMTLKVIQCEKERERSCWMGSLRAGSLSETSWNELSTRYIFIVIKSLPGHHRAAAGVVVTYYYVTASTGSSSSKQYGSLFCMALRLISNHTARLQRIQHAAARVVLYQHSRTSPLSSSELLKQLHWLPTEWRVRFKLDTLTFKDLYTGRPPYLSDLLQHHEPTRSLCSSSSHQLLVPPQINIWISCFSVFCSKSLEFITYQYSWNLTKSLPTFIRHLKTFYFQSAHPLSAAHLA